MIRRGVGHRQEGAGRDPEVLGDGVRGEPDSGHLRLHRVRRDEPADVRDGEVTAEGHAAPRASVLSMNAATNVAAACATIAFP